MKRWTVGAAAIGVMAAAWLALFVALAMETTAHCCGISAACQLEAILRCGDAATPEEILAAMEKGGAER